MRLTRIDLHGFKSFFHRTSLDLPPGISAVVGPNGCGKSNIADAIRWVMGEQSPSKLRGRSMEDVIFAGSATNRGLGLAEVAVTLARRDGIFPNPWHHYQELTVTRRLYRSGESEYLINKIPCRLKDIHHLFMDTGLGNRGYAIIEQGSIGRIVDSRPEERRAWIEEAAGVVKFKAQRQAADRKMEATTHNLERVADILAEVERQAQAMKRQALKAQRHRDFSQRIKGLELALAAARHEELAAVLAEREKEDLALSQRRQDLLAQEAAASAELAAARLTLSQEERELMERRERRLKLAARLRHLEQEQEHLREKMADLARRRDQDQAVLEVESKRLADLEAEAGTVEDRRTKFKDDLAARQELEERAQEVLAEAGRKVDELTRRVSKAKDRLIDLASRRASAKNAIVSAQDRLGSVQARLKRLADQADQAQAERDDLTERVLQGQDDLAVAEEKIEALRADQEVQAESLAQAKEEVNLTRGRAEEVSRRRGRVQAELDGLAALAGRLEGVADGARFLLTDQGLRGENQASPFLGLLAEAVLAPPELETAVEAALANAAETVVAKGVEGALLGLTALKERGTGRAGLTAVGLLGSGPTGEPVPAGSRRLTEMVQFNGPAAQVAKTILDQTLLAEDLPAALKAWRDDERRRPVVTPEGDIIVPPGLLQGGRKGSTQASLLARQRTIRDLAAQVEKLAEEERSRTTDLEAAQERLALVEEQGRALAERTREAQAERAEVDKGLARLTTRLEELARLERVLTAETEAIQADQARQAKLLEESHVLLARVETDQAELDAALRQAEAELKGAIGDQAQRQAEATELKIMVSRLRQQVEQAGQEADRLDQDRRRAEVRVEGLRQALTQAAEVQTASQARLAQAQEEVKDLTLQAGQLDEALHQEQDGLTAQKEDLDRREEDLRSLRTVIRQVEEAARQAGLAVSETRLTIRHLLADVQERHQVDLPAAKSAYLDPDLDHLAAQAELSGLKERLERLGPVNPAAVEEYQALEERRQFLQTQVDDLKASLEDLRQAIRKINKTTIERFLETFHSVADKMAELGPILFGEGAQAELILVNPEDPLETGVDIKVQPAGKKLVSMGLLSGGEKALAAVTLLFAIFLHRPSPFCLLDEVDAPLDEKNVDRFNGLVKEIGRQSQILMITHNRRTMEVAETLHGVTMPEPGVSRLVSVKLDREADKIDELVQTAQA